uniref:Complement factor D n=1 Tax=Gopherus evgoodei TaxID=1825980 RepID=A0A8C4YAU7_9SAUR
QRGVSNLSVLHPRGVPHPAGCSGVVGRPRGRILGGYEAPPHLKPYMASLQVDGKHVCGGFLIAEQWVLIPAFAPDGVGVAGEKGGVEAGASWERRIRPRHRQGQGPFYPPAAGEPSP